MSAITADVQVQPSVRTATGAIDIEARLTELVGSYRRTLAETAKLPFFSIWPGLIFIWNYLIAIYGLLLDFVLIPYNLAVLIGRKFGKNWKYFAPASKRIKYAAIYFWRGEASFGAVIMRPAVRWLLRSHVANRLPKFAELVYLSPDIDDATRFRIIDWLEREKKAWAVQDLTQVSLRGTFPTLVLAAGTFIWNQFDAGGVRDLLQLYAIVALIAVGYFVLTLFLGSFPIKRGLLIGREARRAWAPGGVKGCGVYEKEHEIFAALGGKSRELPIDTIGVLLLALMSVAFLLASYLPDFLKYANPQLRQAVVFYQTAVGAMVGGLEREALLVNQLANAGMTTLFVTVALVRRTMLKRA